MFWELAPYFPDGIVFGIVNPYSKRVLVNPPQELRLSLGDELLILRPTTYKSGKYAIQKTPAKMELGEFTLLEPFAIIWKGRRRRYMSLICPQDSVYSKQQ